MSIREDSMAYARDIQEMTNKHYPDDDSSMQFYALGEVVATVCQDQITAHIPMVREIIELLENSNTSPVIYNDLDNSAHLVDFKPESYRHYAADFERMKSFLIHTQNHSYWFLFKDYSKLHEHGFNDELYIYQAEITHPDYERKNDVQDFVSNGLFYMDGRDKGFLGCSYNSSDSEHEFTEKSNWKFHAIEHALLYLQQLYGELT